MIKKMNVVENDTPDDQEWRKDPGVWAVHHLGGEQKLDPLQQLHWF